MVEWYCRICRCRTTGAAAHVTQLSEFLWLPSPSKNYNQTSENPRTTTFCTQFCTQKVCVQILKVFLHTAHQHTKRKELNGTALHYCQYCRYGDAQIFAAWGHCATALLQGCNIENATALQHCIYKITFLFFWLT